jgi:membrane protease YdiL (CAAX protease family)
VSLAASDQVPAAPAMSSDSGRLLRRPVLTFFVLSLALSWAAWIPYAAAQSGRLAVRVPAELIWLSEYGPSAAALLLTAAEGGGAAVTRLLARLARWRVAAGWYAAALLLTPVLMACAIALHASWSGVAYDVAQLGGWDARFAARTQAFTPSVGIISSLVAFMSGGAWQTAIVMVTIAVTNGGLSEEVGWRGWALPKLQTRRTALTASLVVGVLWALWHTGTGFWQAMFTSTPLDALRFTATYLGQYLVLVLPLAVLYTWIYNGTGGSLLLAVLLHASYNLTVTVVNGAWPSFPLMWFVALIWLAALAVVLIFGPRTLTRR